MAKVEKYAIEGKNIKMFLKEDFLKKIESFGEIFPVSLVFISKEKTDSKKNKISSIIFNHQDDKDAKNNILHIDSPNTELLGKIVKEVEQNE